MTTSLPSSPAPQKSTRVAEGFKGVPILTVFFEPVINIDVLLLSECDLSFPFCHFQQNFPPLVIGHDGPAQNFIARTLATNTDIVFVQRANVHAWRANLVGHLHLQISTFVSVVR